MTTLELFKKHRKGEISRERFLYEVRRDSNLPWVTNTTSYDDAVKILKNKGIIREAQFEPQNIATAPEVDRVNPYALKREVEKLLAKEPELTNDSYKEALNKAAKKLTTPQAVKDAMFANAETVAKADAKLQTQEVKKANHVDKNNGMKKAKGQQAPKATAAPTKENKKTKKPKGVEVMKDKGVEGSEKVIKESVISELTSFLKKKLNLAENSPYHDHSVGQRVPTPHGEGVIKEINGGTLCVEVDGKLYDVQMNVVQKLKEKEKEQPQAQEEIGAKPEYESGLNQLEEEDNEETSLEVGDIVLVTYPNEYQGQKGEVVDLGVGGSFVVVEMPNGDTVSMHSSDVELLDYDEEDDPLGQDDEDSDDGISADDDKHPAGFPGMTEENTIEEAKVPNNILEFAKRKGVTALVQKVANWAEKAGKRIVGGTAIGKNYDTLVLDLTYQGSEIYINCNTKEVTINDEPIYDYDSFLDALDLAKSKGEEDLGEDLFVKGTGSQANTVVATQNASKTALKNAGFKQIPNTQDVK